MALNLRQKKQVNPGTRVRLINMDDPYTKLEPGLEGTVRKIDDIGTIHVNWDNGSSLGLVPDVDDYEVLSENSDNQYRPFPKAGDRNEKIGARNAALYKQAEDEMIDEGNDDSEYETTEEEEDPYEGKERRFRVSFYADVHVPMTENPDNDFKVAEQNASVILKKLSNTDVSNVFIGDIVDHPFGEITNYAAFDR